MPERLRETDLYAPVKALLEGQGYTVKGEVSGADIVACRGDEPPVIVELKTGFSLSLFHQAIDRLRVSDAVYVAVPQGSGRGWLRALQANRTLCRRLGIGLLTVRLPEGHTVIQLDPGPYAPRPNIRRRTRLLREFARREGDPNTGGRPARAGLMTAYRQDALRLAAHLAAHGPTKGAAVADATGVAQATRIMADDHYGWFERVSRGIYGLTPRGHADLAAVGNDTKKPQS